MMMALLLLFSFLIVSIHLDQQSLWADEGWTLWAVREAGLRGGLETLRRAAADVHPPLYFALLDVWVGAAGDSVYAVRLPSALALLLAISATMALGRRMFGSRAALIAGLLLATAPMAIYYGREARMYALLLALSVLVTWAYVALIAPRRTAPTAGRLAWLRRSLGSPSMRYGVFAAALLYTHYAGALVLLAHGIHALIAGQFRRWLLRMIAALLLFAPWGVILWRQWTTHGAPTATPLPTSLETVNILLLVLTTGVPLLFAVPFVLLLLDRAISLRSRLGFGRTCGRRATLVRTLQHGLCRGGLSGAHVRPCTLLIVKGHKPAAAHVILLLLLLLLILPPAALLLINLARPPLFQLRYVIGVLPAGALLVGCALARSLDARAKLPLRLIAGGIALAIVVQQLVFYGLYFPPKPRWNAAAAAYGAARTADQPAITAIMPQSPLAYYDLQIGLRRGISLDLAWRWHEPPEMQAFVDQLANAESVWLVMPSGDARTWDAAAALLAQGRQIGYRDSVMATIFYRFDIGAGDQSPFDFRFVTGERAHLFSYTGSIGAQFYAVAGEPFCFDLPLRRVADTGSAHHVQITLTQGQGTIRAEQSVAVPAFTQPEQAQCVPMPPDAPSGLYHLRIGVEDADRRALHLLEGAEAHYWGEQIIIGTVSVSQ